MLDVNNKDNRQIKEILQSNEYLTFLDDILEVREQLSVFDMASMLGDSFLYPKIGLEEFHQTNKEDKELKHYLMSSYLDNNNKVITYSRDKKDIVEHFKPYFISNHKNLHEFSEVTATTHEYNLISYIIYKGLANFYPRLREDKDTIVVKSLLRSDLLYKLSVELPSYVSLQDLLKKDYVFEEYFKSKTKGFNDGEVKVLIEKVNKDFVFTISRFEIKEAVAFSDILSYGMGTSYSKFMSDELKAPIVLGLIDNEFPEILDLSESKNISIIGTDKSSQLSYSIVLNSVLTNHYEDLNYVICTKRRDTFWHTFSRNPHVLGYHTDIDDFKSIITDVHELAKERLKRSKKTKSKTFKELKPHLDYKPQLILVLDGLSNILARYRTLINGASEEVYKLLFDMINFIARNSHITGVSILSVSERADKTSFPQEILNNSLLKVAMKQASENDIKSLYGSDMADLPRPIGEDYNIVAYAGNYPTFCKTVAIGGMNHEQTLAITRIVAFDWIRKSIYDDIPIVDMPEGLSFLTAYNRNKISADTIKKTIEDKVIHLL